MEITLSDASAAKTFDALIRVLENGALNQELSQELCKLNAHLNDHAHEFGGGKAKGELKLTLKFELKGGIFEILGEISSKLPKVGRARSIAWSTPDNFFAQQDPRQITMFGNPRVVHDGYGANGAKVVDA